MDNILGDPVAKKKFYDKFYDMLAACCTKMILNAPNHQNGNTPSELFGIRKQLEKDKDLSAAVDRYFSHRQPMPTVKQILDQMNIDNGRQVIQRLNPKNMREHTRRIQNNAQIKAK